MFTTTPEYNATSTEATLTEVLGTAAGGAGGAGGAAAAAALSVADATFVTYFDGRCNHYFH